MTPRKKLDVSFEEITETPQAATVKPLHRHDAEPANRDDVTALNQDDVKPSKLEKRAHVSLYVSTKVQRAVKQLALDRNVRAHDLYVDGLRTMLKAHGLDFDALNRGG